MREENFNCACVRSTLYSLWPNALDNTRQRSTILRLAKNRALHSTCMSLYSEKSRAFGTFLRGFQSKQTAICGNLWGAEQVKVLNFIYASITSFMRPQLHLCVLNFIYASSTSFMRPQLHLCVLIFIYACSISFILPQLFSPSSTFSPCSTFVYQQYGLNLCTFCKTFALCFLQIYHSPLIFRSFFNRTRFTSGDKQVLCCFLFPFPPCTRLLIVNSEGT